MKKSLQWSDGNLAEVGVTGPQAGRVGQAARLPYPPSGLVLG